MQDVKIIRLCATACLLLQLLCVNGQFCPTTEIDSIAVISPQEIESYFELDQSGNVLSYEISASLEGQDPDDGQIFSSTSSPIVVTDLVPGTQYDIYMRSRCVAQVSEWTGPYQIVTAVELSDNCDLSISIPDNACPDLVSIPIEVEEGDFILGEDINLNAIELIVSHNWPPDVAAWLSNAAGTRVQLLGLQRIGGDHLGDPGEADCDAPMRITLQACTSVLDAAPPYTSEDLRAIQPLSTLADGSRASGLWMLEICDQGDLLQGTLEHINLEFVPVTCLAPVNLRSIDFDHESVSIGWDQVGLCDSIVLEIGPEGFVPNYDGMNGGPGGEILVIDCEESSATLGDLLADQSYDIYSYTHCDNSLVSSACVFTIQTACDEIGLRQNFEALNLCPPSCNVMCAIEGVFRNTSQDDFDWLVYQGRTPTVGTGPIAGGSRGTVNYIYTESSSQDCRGAAMAILESQCLFKTKSTSSCDVSFSYWMEGSGVGSLSLEILAEDMTDWQDVLTLTGSQASMWLDTSVHLPVDSGRAFSIRFSSTGSTSGQGDIAIDEIELHHIDTLSTERMTYYLDQDQDGFGSIGSATLFCSLTPPAGYVREESDCNDQDSLIHPDALEILCNQIDENCNGVADDLDSTNLIIIDTIISLLPTCVGTSDGSLLVLVEGDEEDFEYSWSIGNDSNAVDGLSSGIYHLTISNQQGCELVVDNIDMQAEQRISMEIDRRVRPACLGDSSGILEITAQGGNPPYDYVWNTEDSLRSLLGIPAGDYLVTITDEDGCTFQSDPIVLTAPSLVEVEISEQRDVACTGDTTGVIDLAVISGIAPYDFIWSTGDITDRIEQLAPGSYDCTVTDARGCIAVLDSILIEENSPLEIEVDALESPLCAGDSSGHILITVVGGEAPYRYSWSDGAEHQDRLGLKAGTYGLTVSDVNDCIFELDAIILEEKPALSVDTATVINSSCRGTDDGVISLDLSGGSPEYRIIWSNGDRDTRVISDLSPGNYSATISDAVGCKLITQDYTIVELNEPLQFSDTQLLRPTCPGDADGSIQVSMATGTSPFIYNWSTGQVDTALADSASIDLLSSGNYMLTVTDANGCVGTLDSLDIPPVMALSFETVKVMDPSCPGFTDGAISVSINGGTPEYRVIWNTEDTSHIITELAQGIYFFDVLDANDCELEGTFYQLTDPDDYMITTSSVPQNGSSANGIARVDVRGATPPYEIVWDDNTGGQIGPVATGLTTGTYCATITDILDCVTDTCVFVDVVNSTEDDELALPRLYHWPNPVEQVLYFQVIEYQDDHPIAIKLLDNVGRSWHYGPLTASQQHIDMSQMPSGLYQLILEDQLNGRAVAQKIVKL